MQKVLVVGSNSFSGATFVDYALKTGAHVLGMSRSEEPVDPLLPYKWGNHSNFEFNKLDLNFYICIILFLINLLIYNETA